MLSGIAWNSSKIAVALLLAMGPRNRPCRRLSDLRRDPGLLRNGDGGGALPRFRRYRHRDVAIASAFVAGGRAGPRISSGKVLAGQSSKAVSPVGQGQRMGAVGAR